MLNVQTRRFNTLFEYNVVGDFQGQNVKNPHYRIVSGVANIRQVVTAGQLARAVVYVAEAASGQVVAYGVPWLPGRAAAVAELLRREVERLSPFASRRHAGFNHDSRWRSLSAAHHLCDGQLDACRS